MAKDLVIPAPLEQVAATFNNENTQNATAFGLLRVAQRDAKFQHQNSADNGLLLNFSQQEIANAAILFQPEYARQRLTTSGTAGDIATRQTRQWWTYEPGRGQLLLGTYNFQGRQRGNVKRLGLLDGEDGVYLGQDDDGPFFAIRTSTGGKTRERIIRQSQWNVDKLDGSGPSGVTLNEEASQIFAVDFQWLGVGEVRYAFNIAGRNLTAHIETNANEFKEVYMRKASLPVRYEIEQVRDGDAGLFDEICMGVFSEGGTDILRLPGSVYAYANGGTENRPITKTIGAVPEPVLLVRLRPDVPNGAALLTNFSAEVQCTSNTVGIAHLSLNPALAGVTTWSDFPNSVLQTADNIGAITFVDALNIGYLFGSSFITQQADVTSLTTRSEWGLGRSLETTVDEPFGVSDIVCVAAGRNVGGANETYSAILNFLANQ